MVTYRLLSLKSPPPTAFLELHHVISLARDSPLPSNYCCLYNLKEALWESCKFQELPETCEFMDFLRLLKFIDCLSHPFLEEYSN